jgi:hypothetical protein
VSNRRIPQCQISNLSA